MAPVVQNAGSPTSDSITKIYATMYRVGRDTPGDPRGDA